MNDAMRQGKSWPRIWGDLAQFLLVAMLALIAALVINQLRAQPLPLMYQTKDERMMRAIEEIGGKVQAMNLASELPTRVSLAEFRAFVVNRQGWVFDARPEVFYDLGHVPSAMSLPREDFEKAYARLRLKLEADKDRPIAVYCSDAGCEDSEMVGQALRKLGYERVTVFKGGWSEWETAALPEEKPE